MRPRAMKRRPERRYLTASSSVACGLLALLVLPGCTGREHGALSSGPAPPRNGTVHGALLLVGGPAPGKPRGVAGTVTMTGSVTRKVRVDDAGHFDTSMPLGRYRVEGRSPVFGSGKYPCHARSLVVVVPHKATKANVYCQAR
jgi:hypothetical protein